MMNNKSEEMTSFVDHLSETIFGKSVSKSHNDNTCVICKGPAVSFSDHLSAKEYSISGMCQVCQDKVFGEDDD